MEEENQRELRVVMFPWFAHGHITPFLELAKSLATHGLQIFFVSTPLNIKRLKPQMFDEQGIELVELPMPFVEGLPAGVESTADVAKSAEARDVLIPLLRAAMDLLEKPFEALLKRISPDMVIHDFVQHWAPRVAAPIPTIYFNIMGMACFSYWEAQLEFLPENPTPRDLTFSPPGLPSSIMKRRLFEANRALGLYQKDRLTDGLSVSERLVICMRECWAIACNTSMVLEAVYVEYLKRLR